MRNAFIRGLTELAERDPRVVLLTGDLGFKIFDDFATRFPGRFYNAGVAEANMMSVAGGLALGGQPWLTMKKNLPITLCKNLTKLPQQ